MNKASHHQSSDHQYLEKLEFRQELRKSWLNFFVTNFRVVILLIVLVSVLGVYSFFQLPRESNPEVKIPIAVVLTSFPGVSPADMEELVTKKIETGISSIKGIKKITSNSSNSFSSVTVEFEADEDLDDSIRRLRDEVNSIKNELPEDANEPVVREISFDDTPIWSISLSGPYDGFTLRSYAEDIQDELEKIPGVREVNISGGDEHEFEISYDPQRLTFYNVTPEQANRAVQSANLAVPSGAFEGKTYTYPVRTDSRFFDVEKIKKIPVSHTEEGGIVFLSDIAQVQEKAIKRTILSRLSIKGGAPQEAVTIDVVKKTGGSILATVEESEKTVNNMVSRFPSGITYDVTTDFAKIIKEDFDRLTHDFFLTIMLVAIILFLLVGLKEAFVAGLAVPLVFFVTFGVMQATGISLNFLSIFSLLLSLGLLVDDAIVVVSATKQYLKTGKFTPEEAVLLVLNDFKVVLTTTTLTTIWAFLPLLSASGIIGSFIKSIPITVSVTLASSLVIALIINHPLAAVLERIRFTKKLFLFDLLAIISAGFALIFTLNPLGYAGSLILFFIAARMIRWYFGSGKLVLAQNKELMEKEWHDPELIKKKLREQGGGNDHNLGSRLIHGIVNFNRILPFYEKCLRAILATTKRRWIVLVSTLAVFVGAVALPVTGIVPTEFFPASDGDLLFVDITAPAGLNLDETNKITEQAEKKLLDYPEIVNFSTIVGRPGASNSLSVAQGSSHLASITVNLIEKEKRVIKSYELAHQIRDDMADIKNATIAVDAPRGGPPSGSAFEARIMGEDLQELDKIAGDLKPVLESIDGVVNADISLKDSPAEYTFRLDPARAELFNVNSALVGSTLRMAISGVEVTTVILEGKEISVNARFAEDQIPTLESLQNIQLANQNGQPIFLRDIAEVELIPSVETITRIDQKRTVLLSASAEGETRPNAIVEEFQKRIKKEYPLPEGYEIVYGGENEQNAESVLSIIRAMIAAGILIVSTLVIQFNSFKKALIVLVTIPLALIGVFIGMAVTGINLSFPGLIGILALFGIVVKNAIILIDKINLNIKSGIQFNEAIIDAGKSRLEAIFITSICTIFGIIPVTLSDETWTALGSAVIFGLMLSSFLTLFIVPVLFRTFVDSKEK